MKPTSDPVEIGDVSGMAPQMPPTLDQPFISTSVIGAYCGLVHKLGADPEGLLAQVGLTPAHCEPPYQQILFRDFAMLLELTVEATGCPDVGMRLSEQQYGLDLLGPVGAALEHAETVGDVFEFCSRHMHVYTSGIQIHLERYSDSDEVLLVYECLADGVAHRRQVMEHLLAINNDDTIRYSGGAARMKEVWFAHEPLASQATYQKRFGCKVRFSEPFDAAVWSVRDLEAKLVNRDPALFQREITNISRRYPNRATISSRVRREVNRALHQDACTRESTAVALGLHPRTLHRWLKREGKTFEMIRDQVRRELAEHYIAQSDASFTEIAARLGFAEPAVLSRACQRWFGASPSELRRSLSRRDLRGDPRQWTTVPQNRTGAR
jgi:AraC-like DNA-binding protein